MKHLKLLFAVAAFAGFGYMQAASAETVPVAPCMTISGAFWPGGTWTQDCTGDTTNQGRQNADALYTGLNNGYTGGQTGPLATHMASVQAKYPYAGRFYLFKTPGDFENYAAANFGGNSKATPPVPATPYPTLADIGNGVLGFSYPDPDPKAPLGAAIYTVVFVQPTPQFTNKVITKVTAHEAGHYLDWLYGAKIKATNLVSNTAFYGHELLYDWSLFNLRTGCKAGGDGVFNAYTDQTGQSNNMVAGQYICTDLGPTVPNGLGGSFTSQYAKVAAANPAQANQLVLTAAWPYVYRTGSTKGTGGNLYPLRELFAETYSSGGELLGNNDNVYSPSEEDVYLSSQSNFPCTQALIRYILTTGTLPPAPPAAAPNGFTGHNPDGSTFTCPRS